MTKLTIRVRNKDLGHLRKLSKLAEMSMEQYVEEVVETWLAEKREASWSVREQQVRRLSSLIAVAEVSQR